MRHHARLVQRGLAVGQHQVPVLQSAVHNLAAAFAVAAAGSGAGAGTRQQLLGNGVPLLQRIVVANNWLTVPQL